MARTLILVLFPFLAVGALAERSRWGSTSGTKDRLNSGRGRANFDRNNAYVSVQAVITKFSNPDGVRMDGKKCDWLSTCDTWIHAWIDLEDPDGPFPHYSVVSNWPKVGEKWDNNNNPVILPQQGLIYRDVCGGQFRGANLRVMVLDWDGMGVREDINQFNCRITRNPDPSEPVGDETYTDVACDAVYKGHPMRLEMKYQIFVTTRSKCDPHNMTTRVRRRPGQRPHNRLHSLIE